MEPGTCYWLTGLSGAGKSTIGRHLAQRLRRDRPQVIYLDGDVMREVFGSQQHYDQDSRQQLAAVYGRMCRMLTSQGQDVVCATISMYEDVRSWNRANIKHYREIYVRVSMATLFQRDQKQLYSRAQRGEISDVMGVDLAFDPPQAPDLILDNEGDRSPQALAETIYAKFHQIHTGDRT